MSNTYTLKTNLLNFKINLFLKTFLIKYKIIVSNLLFIHIFRGIMYAFLQLMPGLGFKFNDCLYFGAMISATDPG